MIDFDTFGLVCDTTTYISWFSVDHTWRYSPLIHINGGEIVGWQLERVSHRTICVTGLVMEVTLIDMT